MSSKTCSICCEKINKSTHKEIICGFCPTENEFIVCVSCVKRYLLETTQNAHCMNCKHEWNRIFIYDKLPKIFLNNEYKQRRQNLIEERERSMMPATQPHVEIAIMRRKLIEYGKEINVLKNRSYLTSLYSDEHLEIEIDRVKVEHKFQCLGNEIRQKENKKKTETHVKFIRQCPIENCKGFLSTAWKCGICNTHVCSRCHEPKEDDGQNKKQDEQEDEQAQDEQEKKEEEQDEQEQEKKEEEQEKEEETTTKIKQKNNYHVCNPDNVETAKLLKNDSKPCPKCACMIFKISGCDQMFCTQCHTAFSWITGRIENRIIHNPHYFQYLREQANGQEIPRNPLDNPCAEIMPDGEAFNGQMIRFMQNSLRNIPSFQLKSKNNDEIRNIRISEEIQKVILISNQIVAYNFNNEPNINDNLDLRIQYMMNAITTEKYKQQLQSREKQNEKNHEFDMIFRTYVTAARDIVLNFVNLSDITEKINKQEEVYNELINLCVYINECFRRLIPVFNNYVWNISMRNNRYVVERIK